MPLDPAFLPTVFDNTGTPQALWRGLVDNEAPIGKWLRCATSHGNLLTDRALAITITPCTGFTSPPVRDMIINDFEECFGDNGTIRGLYEAHSLFPAATTNTSTTLTTTTTTTDQHLASIQHQNATAPAPALSQWGHGQHQGSIATAPSPAPGGFGQPHQFGTIFGQPNQTSPMFGQPQQNNKQ